MALFGDNGQASFLDVQSKLESTGFFETIEIIDSVTPALAQLESYDSVFLVGGAGGTLDQTELGNTLADYVNGDGAFDVVSANSSGRSVTVRLNADDGTGSLGAAQSFSTGNYGSTRGVAVGDVDGDGHVDLVTANNNWSTGVSVLYGSDSGSFGSPRHYATQGTPRKVALGDLNNDGRLDMSTPNFSNRSVSVWLAQGPLALELADPNGNVVATGTDDAPNLDLMIYNVAADSAGTYYVRIPSYTGGDYSLVVTRNAVFDREANDSFGAAQNFDGVVGSLGHLTSSDEDWYSVTLEAGTAYSFPIITAGDGPGGFVNTLNPKIEMFDPSGSFLVPGEVDSDGRNETINYTPSALGLYRIRVTPEAGTSGEYFLDPFSIPQVVSASLPVVPGASPDSSLVTSWMAAADPWLAGPNRSAPLSSLATNRIPAAIADAEDEFRVGRKLLMAQYGLPAEKSKNDPFVADGDQEVNIDWLPLTEEMIQTIDELFAEAPDLLLGDVALDAAGS